jgi:hypothetical protein
MAYQRGMVECVPHRDQQPVRIERFLQEVERAALGGVDCRSDRAVPRDHDDDRVGVDVAQPGERLQPVQSGHLHVEKHEMRAVFAVGADPFPAGGRDLHVHALVFEDLLERLPDSGLIVDDQHAMAHRRPAP